MSNTIIFKGTRFTRSRKAVTLPSDDTPFVRFGYVQLGVHDDQGGKLVKTEWTMGGEPVFAKPIQLSGHSLTNMAYGKNGYAYLFRDGAVYVAKIDNMRKI